MTPQPISPPPLNGHRAAPAGEPVTQPIRDRWGRPYLLRGEIGPSGIRYILTTARGATIGRATLEISDRTGRLVELHIADGAAPWLPRALRRPLVRLLPRWSATGHRDRGLGSLLLIYSLKAACDLELRQVVVADPIPAAAKGLFRNLGFALHPVDTGFTASYRISDQPPPS